MKSAKAYKSAFYSSDSLERGFWDGRAVDLQISGVRELSDYWIRDFLDSQLRTTGPAGTKRMAIALRDAIRSSDGLGVRQELISVATLLGGQDGQYRSARQLLEQLGISQESKVAVESSFLRPDLMDEVFQFDSEEFRQHAPYRAVELDNGGVLIAEDRHFDEVFRQEAVSMGNERTRFVTEGRIVDEYLRKTK